MALHDKYDSEMEGHWFSVNIEGEEQVAFISSKALREHFDPEKKSINPCTVYKRHRKCIETVAQRKFRHSVSEPILLRASDF